MSGFRAIQFLDENGIPYGIKHIDNKPRISENPVGWDVSEGTVTGCTPIRLLGQNPDVDNTREDCIYWGGSYVFPTTGSQMEVVSDNINDTTGGTGVKTVEIHYLTTAYTESSFIMSLSGTTAAPTPVSNIYRVNYFQTYDVGSGGVAAGNIQLRKLGGGDIYGYIPQGINMPLQLVYTVPLGKKMFITDWTCGSGSQAGSRYCEFMLRATVHYDSGTLTYQNGIFRAFDLHASQDASFQKFYQVPLTFPEKTDIKVSVKSDTATANAVGTSTINGFLKVV